MSDGTVSSVLPDVSDSAVRIGQSLTNVMYDWTG